MLAPRLLEKLADIGASACLGGAAAFAAYAGLKPLLALPLTAACAVAAAGFACWLSRTMLGAIAAPVRASAVAAPFAELWLDNVFVPMSPATTDDGRVVRLFDPAAMSRQSMAGDGPQANDMASAASSDASEALRDAFNQLRRSLRQA